MLSLQQIQDYQKNGFLVIEEALNIQEVDILLQKLDIIIAAYLKGGHSSLVEQGVVFEQNEKVIRTINGLHIKQKMFKELCSHPSVLQPVFELLNDKNLYVHQFKVNLKYAFDGDVWPWHQDYIYWQRGDGMPKPQAISVIIPLDDVVEFNGPLMFIPQSHNFGILDIEDIVPEDDNSNWINHVSHNLKYRISQKVVADLANKFGIVVPKPTKGSVMLFDSNIAHASTNNLSPFSRRLIIITYNPISNIARNFVSRRPDFLASKDFAPVQLL